LKFVNWINKIWTHPRDNPIIKETYGDFGIRAVLHIPVGILTTGSTAIEPLLPLVFVFAFVAYEVVEDWRCFDHAWKDMHGYLFGLAIGLIFPILF
jgi:hypothetical protein